MSFHVPHAHQQLYRALISKVRNVLAPETPDFAQITKFTAKFTKNLLLISKVPTIYSKFTFYVPYAPLCGANSKFIVNFE